MQKDMMGRGPRASCSCIKPRTGYNEYTSIEEERKIKGKQEEGGGYERQAGDFSLKKRGQRVCAWGGWQGAS